jgi:hypothetical protein
VGLEFDFCLDEFLRFGHCGGSCYLPPSPPPPQLFVGCAVASLPILMNPRFHAPHAQVFHSRRMDLLGLGKFHSSMCFVASRAAPVGSFVRLVKVVVVFPTQALKLVVVWDVRVLASLGPPILNSFLVNSEAGSRCKSKECVCVCVCVGVCVVGG